MTTITKENVTIKKDNQEEKRQIQNMGNYRYYFRAKNIIFGVSGNIGVGKTTLVQALSEQLGIQAVYEPVETNIYLDDFYKDINAKPPVKPSATALFMQIYLLNARFAQHQRVVWSGNPIIMDRTIYEDVIFAMNLYKQKFIARREFDTYCDLFRNMAHFLQAPHILIFLKTDPTVAMKRIKERSRDAESGMSMEYLEGLDKNYEDWLTNDIQNRIPTMVVDWNKPRDISVNSKDIMKFISELQDFVTKRKVCDSILTF